jgi:alpha/beta superfamily hydrolase
MKQHSIAFSRRNITLEGIVTLPTDLPSPFPGVVLCHAHPLFGESMVSPIMHTLCRALDSEGIATLRFNFRGVGGSGGSFDQGNGEQEDLKAAMETLKDWPGIRGNRIGVAGVSFGAVIALDVLPKARGVKALALLAPTLSAVRRSRLDKFKGAKMLVVGEKDRLVPAEELRSVVALQSASAEYSAIPGADHTWKGYEDQVAAQVAGFLAQALR